MYGSLNRFLKIKPYLWPHFIFCANVRYEVSLQKLLSNSLWMNQVAQSDR